MQTCTLKKLQSEWGGSRKLVEVTDREQALRQIKSACSCCWGGCGSRIGSTGWVQLAGPSPSLPGDPLIRFVCKAKLIEDQLSHV